MIQCFVCQDWFHDRCLSNYKNSTSPSPDLDMICKLCVANCPCLQPYLIEGAAAQMNSDASLCSKPVDGHVNKNEEFFLELENLVQRMCKCENCLRVYSEQRLDFLLHLEDIEARGSNAELVGMELEHDEETGVVEEPFDVEKIALHALSSMPRQSALDVAAGLQAFLTQVASGIRERASNKCVDDDEPVVITEDDVAVVLEKVNQNLDKKRKRDA
jgi:hypothetical protein